MKKLISFSVFSLVLALLLYSAFDFFADREEGTGTGGEYNVSGDTEQEGTAIVPPNASEGTEIGAQAPDLPLETMSGRKTSVEAYKGKPIILNIWATWCPPCREEMPELQKFHETYGDDVTVLAVNATGTEEAPSRVSTYIEEEGFTFETVLDVEENLSEKYQTFSIPATYFINSDGTIHSRKFGPMTYDYIVQKMKKLE